jgi:hypothetical protein
MDTRHTPLLCTAQLGTAPELQRALLYGQAESHFVVYVRTLSDPHYAVSVIGCLIYNELENMRNEPVAAVPRYRLGICLDGLRQNTEVLPVQPVSERDSKLVRH